MEREVTESRCDSFEIATGKEKQTADEGNGEATGSVAKVTVDRGCKNI